MTRCRKGDICLVVTGDPDFNVGRIVKVTTRCWSVVAALLGFFGISLWYYEGELTNEFGVRFEAVSDDCLRPLRNPGQDEADEMVRIAGIPHEIAEKQTA
jgi:hypothetical protein